MKLKHIRRWLPLLLCSLLLCSGCTGRSPEQAAEKVNISALQYELENQTIDCDSMPFFQELEERTGVHVDFEEVNDVDWTTRLSLMFASSRYQDVILRGSLDTEEYGVTEHLLLPLEDYLPSCMPNYCARLRESGYEQETRSSDGHIYFIGFLLSQGVNTDGHFFLNTEWMNRLGLETPATAGELTEVLRAFRDRDPNGNGQADEVPWQATFDDTNTGIYNAFSFFGLPMNKDYVYIDGAGKVHFAPTEESFAECAAWLHELCVERLLDVECITQGSNLWAAKVNRNTAGFFSYWRLTNTALEKEITDQFSCVLPVAAEGHRARMPRIEDVVEFGASLTVQNEHPEETLRWLDAQFETETMLISQNGPVGETLTRREDGKYEVGYVPPAAELYRRVPVICGQFFAPDEYYQEVYVPAAHRVEKRGYCDIYEKAGVLEDTSYYELTYVMPQTAEEAEQLRLLKNQLKAAVDEGLVRFMTNGLTEQDFRDFQHTLRQAGAERYTEIYQAAYDRYLASREERP